MGQQSAAKAQRRAAKAVRKGLAPIEQRATATLEKHQAARRTEVQAANKRIEVWRSIAREEADKSERLLATAGELRQRIAELEADKAHLDEKLRQTMDESDALRARVAELEEQVGELKSTLATAGV